MVPETRHEPAAGSHSQQSQPFPGRNLKERSLMRLQRTLTPLETWGFGLTGHVIWPSIAPAIHAALGPNAVFVWLPGAIVGILLNLQVKRLGENWPEMAGGTPNYAARLLKSSPGLARYAALGYYISWISNVPVAAIILTKLIQRNLEPLGVACPDTLMKIGFVAVVFIVAFSGTRALSILHLCFVIPAFGLLLLFCLQGLGWLAFSPSSPGFFPSSSSPLTFVEWAKWFFFVTYATYAGETASSFVGDSKRPAETLRFLTVAAWLIPPVFLGGSWVLMRLATEPGLGEDTFLNLLAASKPFWGKSASSTVTFLLSASFLLSCATAVSNCPRILYQLSLDGHLSSVFAVVSRRGVLGPALVFTLCLNLICLIWGNVSQIVAITNTCWLVSFMALHLGLWLRRGRPEVRWPWLSLGFFLVEVAVLFVGGFAWGWKNFLTGFLFPLAILAADAAMRRLPFAPFHAAWWIQGYRQRPKKPIEDFVALQVTVLILLVCSAVTAGWVLGLKFNAVPSVNYNLLLVLIHGVAFVGVAIACWTSLPQVVSMDEAREAAEQLFKIALDAIAVLDENGMIRQVNPAAERLFGVSAGQLAGRHLNQLLPGLANQPDEWPGRCEQTLNPHGSNPLVLEVAISDRFSQNASETNRDLQEYVVILRDITERVRAQEALQKANEQLEIKVEERTSELRQTVEQLQVEITERRRVEENLRAMQNQIIVQEKLASLGSLTAGIAHEIRNPLNFVNNFSELSAELAQELFEEIENQADRLDTETSELIADILNDLKQNLQKINHHGQRADRIVSNMLLHSRGKSGQWEATDINSLLAEYVNLAYHGMRAKEASFNITIETGCDESIGSVEVVPQDMGRVFLNIINNACYAAHKRKEEMGGGFSPLLSVRTKNLGDRVEIRIRDNGSGMTPEVRDKLFTPFFTTKPAGEGTGLGLSISHDIVVQQHRGELNVETEAGSYAEFIIILPKKQARE
ncbi:MAG: amino acid permease [Oscillatoria princeps RMCB-10]|jgi:PAS domain S-box-containing protein|nr:amino acid permease [Oscillatoria princeps RMCB-10]